MFSGQLNVLQSRFFANYFISYHLLPRISMVKVSRLYHGLRFCIPKRCAFRNQPNMYDRAFLRKQLPVIFTGNSYRPVTFFCKKATSQMFDGILNTLRPGVNVTHKILHQFSTSSKKRKYRTAASLGKLGKSGNRNMYQG